MKRMIVAAICMMACIVSMAQEAPEVHIEGRHVVDSHGKKVVMHGVMDTPSEWFNSGRWGWDSYDASTTPAKCVAYFEKLFTAITDSTQGAWCTIFRLHLDPCWTNNNSVRAAGFTQKDNKWYDPNGVEVGGEANIVHFDKNRLTKFMGSVYVPIIKKALAHGLHVIIRPPGVFPSNVKVGDYYNKYLMTVWDIVSKNSTIQQYSGQISIELGNEPVGLKDANGNDNPTAMHDFFQPIADKIRENGFTGIIWVPGKTWQQDYRDYEDHPITGYNIGYAVHCYTGWYGQSDENANGDVFTKNFGNSVPVVWTNPIAITEIDWSPSRPDLDNDGNYQYNPDGSLKTKNYGTWATGTTSKWGNAYKQMKDYYGNISMTLTSTDDLIDMDYYLKTKKIRPAFQEAMTANGIDPSEACGKACLDWYAEYARIDRLPVTTEQVTMTSLDMASGMDDVEVMVSAGRNVEIWATFADGHKENVASEARYTCSWPELLSINGGRIRGLREGAAEVTAVYKDGVGNEREVKFRVSSTYFPWASDCISKNIFGDGRYDESKRIFYPSQWGQMGWQYQSGADFSGYKYLVVKLDKSASASSADIRLYAQNSIWGGSSYIHSLGSLKQVAIPLQTIKYTDGDKKGQAVDLTKIYMVAIWTNGNSAGVDFNDVYLTNNDDYSRETNTGIIATVPSSEGNSKAKIYDLSGRQVMNPTRGIYIVNGRKVVF